MDSFVAARLAMTEAFFAVFCLQKEVLPLLSSLFTFSEILSGYFMDAGRAAI